MGYIPNELTAHCFGVVQRICHLIETDGKLGEFIAILTGTADFHPVLVMAIGNKLAG